MNGRAVSHMVGFILIFGIILTGSTMALVIGQDQLSDISTNEQTANAERAMVLLGQNVDRLTYSRSASAESTMNVNNGRIGHENVSSVNLTVETVTGTDTDWTVPTGSFAYEMDDTVVRYENGIIIRSDRGNGVALTEPKLTCADDRATVSLVTIRGDEDRQVSSSRVTVDTYLNETRLIYPINRSGEDSASDATKLTLDVTSSHEDVWSDTVRDHTNWTQSGGKFECVVGTGGEIHVRQTVLDLSLQQ